MTTGSPKVPPRDRSQKVQAAIKRLREAHESGKLLLEACPFGRTDRENTMVAEARKHRVNLDTAYKLRVFARDYTNSQLDALCNLCEVHGRALGFTFVTKFLTLHNRATRAEFQKEVIVNGWSMIETKLALTARYGRQALHGMAGKRPRIGSPEDLLADVATKCIWWERLARMLGNESRKMATETTLSLANIPSEIRTPFRKVVAWIEQLKDAVDEYLKASRRRSQAPRRQNVRRSRPDDQQGATHQGKGQRGRKRAIASTDAKMDKGRRRRPNTRSHGLVEGSGIL